MGTVQGSILGQILYAVFVALLFELEMVTLFTDDNYVLPWNKNLAVLIIGMNKSIEPITKWLRQAGFKVNETKTKICLFHLKDHLPIEIQIFETTIISKK